MSKYLINNNPNKQFNPNYPQFRSSFLYRELTSVYFGPRGVGKSFDVGYHSQDVAHTMARASFVFAGITYAFLLDYGLPPIISTWNQLGYIENVHYVLFKKPKDGFFARKPYVMPMKWDKVISWYTGAVCYLASQDTDAPFRGPTIDGVYGDEFLTFKQDVFEEQILGANRGIRKGLSDNPEHHFVRLSSTKKIGNAGRWGLDYGNQFFAQFPQMMQLLYNITELQFQYFSSKEPLERQELKTAIYAKKQMVQFVPVNNIYYHESDAFDNIVNLGRRYFVENMKRMSPIRFKVELLNQTMSFTEFGFYPDLDLAKHVYFAFNYSQFDPEIYVPGQARKHSYQTDSDVVKSMPLKIAVDWGASITFCGVWQRIGREIRALKNIYVKHPKILDDCATDFVSYYAQHPTKVVYMWYDHTGNDRRANSKFNYAEQFAGILRKAGWVVHLMTKGAAPLHGKKYMLAQRLLREDDSNLPYFRANGNNCKEMLLSMQLAPVKVSASRDEEIKKDKSSETDPDFPQEEATHGSDVADIMFNAEASIDAHRIFLPTVYS